MAKRLRKSKKLKDAEHAIYLQLQQMNLPEDVEVLHRLSEFYRDIMVALWRRADDLQAETTGAKVLAKRLRSKQRAPRNVG
jgi:hypothetical protein